MSKLELTCMTVIASAFAFVFWLAVFISFGWITINSPTRYSEWQQKTFMCRTASGIGGYGPTESCFEVYVRPR